MTSPMTLTVLEALNGAKLIGPITLDDVIMGNATVNGNMTATGTVQGDDLVATDDLTVGDDATVGGDLAVTGNGTIGGTFGVTGNSAFSTLSASGLITANGGQIKFPATQIPSADANTLDDYEEGTWTPTITAASGTFTTVSATGAYVKIGSLCTVVISITQTNIGTAASTMIATLPFTVEAKSWVGCGRNNTSGGHMVQGIFFASAATVGMLRYDNTTAIGPNGQNTIFSGTYKVA